MSNFNIRLDDVFGNEVVVPVTVFYESNNSTTLYPGFTDAQTPWIYPLISNPSTEDPHIHSYTALTFIESYKSTFNSNSPTNPFVYANIKPKYGSFGRTKGSNENQAVLDITGLSGLNQVQLSSYFIHPKNQNALNYIGKVTHGIKVWATKLGNNEFTLLLRHTQWVGDRVYAGYMQDVRAFAHNIAHIESSEITWGVCSYTGANEDSIANRASANDFTRIGPSEDSFHKKGVINNITKTLTPSIVELDEHKITLKIDKATDIVANTKLFPFQYAYAQFPEFGDVKRIYREDEIRASHTPSLNTVSSLKPTYTDNFQGVFVRAISPQEGRYNASLGFSYNTNEGTWCFYLYERERESQGGTLRPYRTYDPLSMLNHGGDAYDKAEYVRPIGYGYTLTELTSGSLEDQFGISIQDYEVLFIPPPNIALSDQNQNLVMPYPVRGGGMQSDYCLLGHYMFNRIQTGTVEVMNHLSNFMDEVDHLNPMFRSNTNSKLMCGYQTPASPSEIQYDATGINTWLRGIEVYAWYIGAELEMTFKVVLKHKTTKAALSSSLTLKITRPPSQPSDTSSNFGSIPHYFDLIQQSSTGDTTLTQFLSQSFVSSSKSKFTLKSTFTGATKIPSYTLEAVDGSYYRESSPFGNKTRKFTVKKVERYVPNLIKVQHNKDFGLYENAHDLGFKAKLIYEPTPKDRFYIPIFSSDAGYRTMFNHSSILNLSGSGYPEEFAISTPLLVPFGYYSADKHLYNGKDMYTRGHEVYHHLNGDKLHQTGIYFCLYRNGTIGFSSPQSQFAPFIANRSADKRLNSSGPSYMEKAQNYYTDIWLNDYIDEPSEFEFKLKYLAAGEVITFPEFTNIDMDTWHDFSTVGMYYFGITDAVKPNSSEVVPDFGMHRRHFELQVRKKGTNQISTRTFKLTLNIQAVEYELVPNLTE